MNENCKTIAANMRHAARNRQSATIGGGIFGPAELAAAADRLDVSRELLEAVRWAAGILLDMQEATHANRLIALAEKAERPC